MRPVRAMLAAALACVASAALAAPALDPELNTDGFNPASENYLIGEAARLEQIARQRELNARMIEAYGHGASPFEPWPRVPGDIWGYPNNRAIQQPLGHESQQTGPNRWVYRPIYPTPLPPPARRPTPILKPIPRQQPAQVELPHPSDAAPADNTPRGGAVKRVPAGPRDF